MGSEPILVLRDICVRRGRGTDGWAVTLDDLQLVENEVAALLGPSGCGKTSLLMGCVGLVPELRVTGERKTARAITPTGAWPDSGTAAWRAMMAGPVTLLHQDAKAALDPLQTVETQMKTVTGESADSCRGALAALGLTEAGIADAFPHTLSGGQAQKVLLAIANLRAPALLIADEPTAGLDGDSIDGFVSGLRLLREGHGTAVLLATHDASLVADVGGRSYAYGIRPGSSGTPDVGGFSLSPAVGETWSKAELPPPGEVILEAKGVHKSFRGAPVLDGVDLSLRRGEVVSIVGPSGCGKTTLARILTGHLSVDSGVVSGSAARQMLFQNAHGSLTPGRTIRSLVEETRTPAFDVAKEAAAIGLQTEKLSRVAGQLSGGERRRAALLRALSVEPPILVLDEPTASLDHESAVSVIRMILGAQERRRLTCLLITHDRSLADAVSHRVLELQGGRLT